MDTRVYVLPLSIQLAMPFRIKMPLPLPFPMTSLSSLLSDIFLSQGPGSANALVSQRDIPLHIKILEFQHIQSPRHVFYFSLAIMSGSSTE